MMSEKKKCLSGAQKRKKKALNDTYVSKLTKITGFFNTDTKSFNLNDKFNNDLLERKYIIYAYVLH